MNTQLNVDETLEEYLKFLMEILGPKLDRHSTDKPLAALVVQALAAMKLQDSSLKLEQSSKRLEFWTRVLVGSTIVLIITAVLNAILTGILIFRT